MSPSDIGIVAVIAALTAVAIVLVLRRTRRRRRAAEAAAAADESGRSRHPAADPGRHRLPLGIGERLRVRGSKPRRPPKPQRPPRRSPQPLPQPPSAMRPVRQAPPRRPPRRRLVRSGPRTATKQASNRRRPTATGCGATWRWSCCASRWPSWVGTAVMPAFTATPDPTEPPAAVAVVSTASPLRRRRCPPAPRPVHRRAPPSSLPSPTVGPSPTPPSTVKPTPKPTAKPRPKATPLRTQDPPPGPANAQANAQAEAQAHAGRRQDRAVLRQGFVHGHLRRDWLDRREDVPVDGGRDQLDELQRDPHLRFRWRLHGRAQGHRTGRQ